MATMNNYIRVQIKKTLHKACNKKTHNTVAGVHRVKEIEKTILITLQLTENEMRNNDNYLVEKIT